MYIQVAPWRSFHELLTRLIVDWHIFLRVGCTCNCEAWSRLNRFWFLIRSRIVSAWKACNRQSLGWFIVLWTFSFLDLYQLILIMLVDRVFWCSRWSSLINVTHFTTVVGQNWLVAMFYRDCVLRRFNLWRIRHFVIIQVLIVIGTTYVWTLLVKVSVRWVP